jgi:hypothetical protein
MRLRLVISKKLQQKKLTPRHTCFIVSAIIAVAKILNFYADPALTTGKIFVFYSGLVPDKAQIQYSISVAFLRNKQKLT